MERPTIEQLIKLNLELPRKLKVSKNGHFFASDGKKVEATPLSPNYIIVDRKYNHEVIQPTGFKDKIWRPYHYRESTPYTIPLSCGEVRLLLGRDFPWGYDSNSQIDAPLEVVNKFCNFNAYLLGAETMGATNQGTVLIPVMLFNISKERQRALAIDKKTLQYTIEMIEQERQDNK